MPTRALPPNSPGVGRAGYTHCESVSALLTHEDELAKGPRALRTWLAGTDVCHSSRGGEEVSHEDVGPGGKPLVVGERRIVCLRSEGWEGCHYSFTDAVQKK